MTKLSVMPYSVLLPELGSLRDLSSMVEDLDQHREQLQESDDRQAEEMMLKQVLHWLQVGDE